jgi:hypothetical protein
MFLTSRMRKTRIQHFLSGLPQSYQDKIEFDEPKTLEDTIRKAKCCYDQSKHKQEPSKDWKRKDKSGFQKKGFKSFPYKNPRKVLSLVNRAEVCINKTFHLRVEIGQQK